LKGVNYMISVVITGANRGLGCALATLCLERGDTVFAGLGPFPADELETAVKGHERNLHAVPLDLTSDESISSAAAAIGDKAGSIDLLVNNAGMGRSNDSLGAANLKDLTDLYLVNAAGPLVLVRHLLPLLAAGDGGTIVNITSESGAVDPPHAKDDIFGYAASKAAANCITGHLARQLKQKGIVAVAMHPGWVRTQMGGEMAPLTPRESGEGILKVARSLTPDDTGKFLTHTGEQHHW
jgi:NAD(P)-dependent dehydrogenase (short-subunit alcohol dehydrogenase family)